MFYNMSGYNLKFNDNMTLDVVIDLYPKKDFSVKQTNFSTV